MFDRLFANLVNSFLAVLNGVSSVLVVFVSIGVVLVAYKKYRQAIFLENPKANKEFLAFYQGSQANYDNEQEAAKDFLNLKKLAAEYEMLHAKDIKRDKFYEKRRERRNAYYYIQSLNLEDVKLDEHQYEYVGYDPHWVADRYYDNDDDGGYAYYYDDIDNNEQR